MEHINGDEYMKKLRTRTPRIALIFTGGTIESTYKQDTQSIDVYDNGSNECQLIDLLLDAESDRLSKYELITEDPDPSRHLNKLSENINPQDWGTIAEKIAIRINQGVDGVVVTHGTDTMAYTTSAISFMLSDATIPVPIVFTGSLIPPERKNTDAIKNLYNSIIFAAESKFSGVFSVFNHIIENNNKKCNEAESYSVILGSRLRSIEPFGKNFYSSDHKVLTTIKNGEFEKNFTNIINKCLPRSSLNKRIIVKSKIEPNVAYFKMYPGFNPHWIKRAIENYEYKGIILELYHSATACAIENGNSKYSILDAIKKCKNMNIPIFGVPSYEFLSPSRYTLDKYSTTNLLLKSDLRLLSMSPEAAVTKLMWLLHRSNVKSGTNITEKMEEDIAGEKLIYMR